MEERHEVSSPTPLPILCVLMLTCSVAAASGETYRTEGGDQWIKLVSSGWISSGELEYHTEGSTFLCKYSSQQDSLRVVMTVHGTQQVLYFRRTPTGLLSERGLNFYSEAALADLQRQRQREYQARQKAQQGGNAPREAEQLARKGLAPGARRRRSDWRTNARARKPKGCSASSSPLTQHCTAPGASTVPWNGAVPSFDPRTGAVTAESDAVSSSQGMW